jgi:hypothetical protein
MLFHRCSLAQTCRGNGSRCRAEDFPRICSIFLHSHPLSRLHDRSRPLLEDLLIVTVQLETDSEGHSISTRVDLEKSWKLATRPCLDRLAIPEAPVGLGESRLVIVSSASFNRLIVSAHKNPISGFFSRYSESNRRILFSIKIPITQDIQAFMKKRIPARHFNGLFA